jgi:amidophosphoribosyltransferase
MCGVIGLIKGSDPNGTCIQQLVDGLMMLQHRGQDATGIVTIKDNRMNLRKDIGTVSDVFTQESVKNLTGNVGIGHVRYPTAGGACASEAQPLYVNSPFGIAIAHNGNLTNTTEMHTSMEEDRRHINTDSDSELLLNIFAEELQRRRLSRVTADEVFDTVRGVMRRVKGGYAVVLLINRIGLVAFRDPNAVRPLCFGRRVPSSPPPPPPPVAAAAAAAASVVGGRAADTNSDGDGDGDDDDDDDGGGGGGGGGGDVCHSGGGAGCDWVVASESVAIDAMGPDFKLCRDVAPGEVVFIDFRGTFHSHVVHPSPRLHPCLFEYVYFARPDTTLDGVPVYEARSRMGVALAKRIQREEGGAPSIDTVMPIPETSRTSALQCAAVLGVSYREGFVKNRYIARTFIMPGQEQRAKTVRLKLNCIKSEFKGKNVLLVDDSIVRGTTSGELVRMAREAGAHKVYFASAAPPVIYSNIYGIDIPSRSELVAFNRNEEEIAKLLGCDGPVYYNSLADCQESVRSVNPTHLTDTFESSCFDGVYVTGDAAASEACSSNGGGGGRGARAAGAFEVAKLPQVVTLAGAPSAADAATGAGAGAAGADTTAAAAAVGGESLPQTTCPLPPPQAVVAGNVEEGQQQQQQQQQQQRQQQQSRKRRSASDCESIGSGTKRGGCKPGVNAELL